MIITMDGPAGSGKTTAARQLARKLGIAYLDTGATYRAVTLLALRSDVDLEDTQALADLAGAMDFRMVPEPEGMRFFVNDQDVTVNLRSAEVTKNAYYAANAPLVRDVLVSLQRRLGEQFGDFVAEGRDQGSVVFPQADVKFYLDAAATTRAGRRHKEMNESGEKASPQEVLDAILQRDDRDRRREVAPLIKPPGAIEIDTTGMSIEQVTAELLRRLEGGR